MIQKAIARIRQMEIYFDMLQKCADENPKALQTDENMKEMLQILLQYYDGGQWLKDYETDERGLLPKDLKRGVLSQDGVYNFLYKLQNMEE